jgi:serine/threonine-protein kinase
VQVDGRYLLIMELMTTTVSDMLQDEGPFSTERVLAVARDITRALAYAEANRLVHRDVKPENILVTEEGVYKLADLGIAAHIADDGRAQQDKAYGSPHYVAPEQARGGAIDGRADLYALGASLWQLATGKTLFEGNARQLVNHHCLTPVPDLRRLAPHLSAPVVSLIGRLLEKTPERRPAHATEVNRQVEQILATLSNRGPSAPIRRVRRPLRRMR